MKILKVLCSLIRGLRHGSFCFIYPNVKIGKGVTIFPCAVLGRPPMTTGITVRIDVDKLGPLVIGEGCQIGPNAVIYKGTKIGNYSMICEGACLREKVQIGHHTLIGQGVKINFGAVIGNNVKINNLTYITGNTTIGDDVFVGTLVSTASDNTMGKSGKPQDELLGPTIKNGVRIGHGACIHPGITIGEYAIVGANSVVTKDVRMRDTVMGVPARGRSREGWDKVSLAIDKGGKS